MNYRLFCFLGIFLSFTIVLAAAPGKLTFDKYHQPKELNTLLKSWTSKYPQLTKLIFSVSLQRKKALLNQILGRQYLYLPI